MTRGTGCPMQQSGAVELFFYDELDGVARDRMSAHLRDCRECATALGELRMIREALASRPDVAAPPAGDWSGFMRRLDASIHKAVEAGFSRPDSEGRPQPVNGRLKPASTTETGRLKPASTYGLLAMAALLAIVTISVVFVARGRSSYVISPADVAAGAGHATPVATTGLKSVGEQHFERSKLVVLGLAAKEPAETPVADWAYERELATSLLNDTRLYRLAAEERGLTSLAGTMRDLELVLLETSMAEATDKAALGQIQRLIRKRGLIEKMDSVATVGM